MGCLGTFGVCSIAYLARFHGISPPRYIFLMALGLTVAPIYGAIKGRTPLFFALPSVVVIFLLYPIFNPHGLPYWRDAVFNFQFSQTILQTGKWTPGNGTISAQTYTYYPIENMYNAIASILLGVPLEITFLWAEPLMRLSILPATIFAYSRRWFSSSVAMLSVVIYGGTASILFNLPVQQEFALPFIALTLMLFTVQTKAGQLDVRITLLVVIFSSTVVAAHHLSSYVMALWLASLVFIPYIIQRPGEPLNLRTPVTLARYLAVLLVYVYFVTVHIAYRQLRQIYDAGLNIIQVRPSPGQVSTLGQSFQPYEIMWLVSSIVVVLLLSTLGIRRLLLTRENTFAAVNALFGVALTLMTFPFLSSSLYFLPLRITEYSYLMLSPVAAWFVLEGWPSPVAVAPALSEAGRSLRTVLGAARPFFAAWLILLVITGGSLAPLSTRQYFTSPESQSVESPLFITSNSESAADWAHTHLRSSSGLWGDDNIVSVYGGFGRFQMKWNQFSVFNGTTLDNQNLKSVSVGDYVIVNRYMTTVAPGFRDYHVPQATAPLSPSQLEKFGGNPYFASVYQDDVYTVYMMVRRPAPATL